MLFVLTGYVFTYTVHPGITQVRRLADRICGGEAATVFVGRASEQPVAARTITQRVVLTSGFSNKMNHLVDYLTSLQTADEDSPSTDGSDAAAAADDDRSADGAVSARGGGGKGGRSSPTARQQRGGGGRGSEPRRVIIFVNTKRAADELQWTLRGE